MTKLTSFRMIALVVCFVALIAAHYRPNTEILMYETASRFIDSLSGRGQSMAVLEFSDKSRTEWHFFPDKFFTKEYGYPRKGISYKHMEPGQRKLADALLSAGLSRVGFAKVTAVQTLEEILRVLDNDTTGMRDIEKYYFSIFGKPSLKGTWGFRVEGHHLSLNFTIKKGRLIASSPTFLGANPHKVPAGPNKGMRVLAKEEDIARTLVKSLSKKQLKRALVAGVAYPDILTKADSRARLDGEPTGLPASEMTEKQFENLMALIYEYARVLSPDIAQDRINSADKTPRDRLFFAWAGSVQPGLGDYYRVQSPKFLIEYDNTQNKNNHSHCVWRDFSGDFGRDLLAQHYRQNHLQNLAHNDSVFSVEIPNNF